ncbi:MAG: hypothetical protein AB7O54_15660 [Pseudomonadales bacterium]
MQGRSAPEPIQAPIEANSAQAGERYDSAQDNLARFVVYFGPYILWGSLGAMAGVIFLIAG